MPRLFCAALVVAMVFGLSFGHAATQQSLVPRVTPSKATIGQMQAQPTSNQVIVKFREGTSVRLRNGRLSSTSSGDVIAFESTLRELEIPLNAMRRMHTRPEAELEAERI